MKCSVTVGGVQSELIERGGPELPGEEVHVRVEPVEDTLRPPDVLAQPPPPLRLGLDYVDAQAERGELFLAYLKS